LQIVIHGYDIVPRAFPEATEIGIVLPVILQQIDGNHFLVGFCKDGDGWPARILAAIVHEDDFVGQCLCSKERAHALDRLLDDVGAVVNGDDDAVLRHLDGEQAQLFCALQARNQL